MKLLIITQKVDLGDDLLGFFNNWIKEFAKNFERIFIITLAKGGYDLPANVEVFSLGKESGASKSIQAFRFLKLLIRNIPKCDGIFAHMSPIFAISAWPFKKIFHKKLIFWYLHRSASLKAKLAFQFSDFVATASKDSLSIRRDNIIEVGHGIDLDFFKTERNWPKELTNIISVGRISPIKGLEILIQVMKIILETNRNINLKIIGRSVMPGDDVYLSKLKNLASDLNIDKFVEFSGFVPYKKMPSVYKNAEISVNLTPKGGIDKAVLESMASGLLVLTSNEAFRPYFGQYADELLFTFGSPESLANALEHLINLPLEQKQSISNFLIGSVAKHHNLSVTISSIANLLRDNKKDV